MNFSYINTALLIAKLIFKFIKSMEPITKQKCSSLAKNKANKYIKKSYI